MNSFLIFCNLVIFACNITISVSIAITNLDLLLYLTGIDTIFETSNGLFIKVLWFGGFGANFIVRIFNLENELLSLVVSIIV